MTFPSPSHSAQSSIASGTDKPSASRSTRSQQSPWGIATSQSTSRRGLTPLATNNLPSSSISASSSRRPPQSHSPGPTGSTTSPLTSSFSAVLTSTSRFPRNNPSPIPTSSSFTSLQSGAQQQAHSVQSITSPKSSTLPSSAGSYLASTASTTGGGSGGGGGGGGGGGPGISRGATFSPLLAGTTVNSPTGFPSDKPSSATTSGAGQSSLSKISVAQVFLLLDSINEKEGKEKWETKAAQIHRVSYTSCPPPRRYPYSRERFTNPISAACRLQRNGSVF